ncbi:pyruvate synthase beta chain [Methanocella paludicola SANAE]|uniref:Pyruvate synthase beta chain n=1 Tax=Methanocella paludicola (strain DSM 17711 / JCM 13418 / NBRC 101707 / SANAE) TaxID=304371 RepID=D1Z1W4_METPS|nr:pyruvate synthase subunit PorB [Methanocella paludicola]BAI62686.1 pyruvate synthase beta chain [Methanocella paludicola SANAE]
MAALEDLFASGHRACAGCGCALTLKTLMHVVGPNVIIANATGCMEVIASPYPETAWKVPWIHSLFENAAPVAAGIEAGLKATGRKNDTKVIAIGGDGATFDIGFGFLSGVMERGHDILYLCYDNEAYMNTGIQRSGSTPYDASTTTTPSGKISFGNQRPKKNMPAIMAAHGVPYVAVTSIGYPADFTKKIRKALSIEGPKYIQVHATCTPGWGVDSAQSIEILRLAVETAMYPLFEYENGEVTSVHKIKDRKPVREYLEKQKRFSHLFKMPGGDKEIEKIQQLADANAARFGLDVKPKAPQGAAPEK